MASKNPREHRDKVGIDLCEVNMLIKVLLYCPDDGEASDPGASLRRKMTAAALCSSSCGQKHSELCGTSLNTSYRQACTVNTVYGVNSAFHCKLDIR